MWGEIKTNWEIDAAHLTNPQDFHLYEIIDSHQIQNKDIFFFSFPLPPSNSCVVLESCALLSRNGKYELNY